MGYTMEDMKYLEDRNKRRIMRRLRIIEGQMRGLQELIRKDTYCIDVITQTTAVRMGLSKVEDVLLENHLDGCVLRQVASGEAGKAKREILKVYQLKRR